MGKRLQSSSEFMDRISNDDIFGAEDTSVKLKYRTDTLPIKSDICLALRIDTRAFLKKWKRNREGRLSWHLCTFLHLVAIRDKEQGTSHDVLLSIYGLEHLGTSDPTYAEFRRFWLGSL